MLLEQTITYAASALGVGSVADGMAMVVVNGQAKLIYRDEATQKAHSLSLGAVASPGSGYVTSSTASDGLNWSAVQPGSGLAFHAEGSVTRMFMFGAHAGALTSCVINSNGALAATATAATSAGTLTGVETMVVARVGAEDVAALSFWGKPGLKIYDVAADGYLSHKSTLIDTDKTYLADVSDTTTLLLAGQTYLLALSPLENGITSFAMSSDGAAELIDSLGGHDDLYVAGPAALQVVELAGVSYAVIASTGSSSLSVVRVNDMGCLFPVSHVVDDLTTRFEHPVALDTFTVKGRIFIVTAGSDSGICFFEMLPGGQLSHFFSLPMETGAGIGSVTSIEIAVNGNEAQLFLIDDSAGRILELDFSFSDTGGLITATGGVANGSTLSDRIMGTGANETLKGNQGADFIHDGGGADTVFGGAGADVFVFGLDSSVDRINDFELHIDRIDISEWGRFYSVDALVIKSTATGAEISFGSHKVIVTSLNGNSLTAASFSESDFIF